MTYFSRQRDVKKTRKVHPCEACERPIAKGSKATYFAGTFEGDFYSAHYHPDCREAENAWNAAAGFSGDEHTVLWVMFEEGDSDPHFFDTDEARTFRRRLSQDCPAVFTRLLEREAARATGEAA